jgi:hypothetical protein
LIFLDSEKIGDPYARENLEKISEILNSNPLIRGDFKSFEFTVTQTGSIIKVRHNLRYTPTDVFVSWVTNDSTIVLKYDQIDDEFLAFTSSQECRLRLIIGRIA